ncbi:hypothetical protein F2Q70_00019100 [Brassica cretica]|uniref:PCI domain-containing protein n=1 Tax=Brassica cretica TaxID=69181 RepID=A0A8S9GVZ2_BRACR|nr:hypothetical protein F2Q70_00019100 [Brassica cretica]
MHHCSLKEPHILQCLAVCIPQLSPYQILKLKQLTLLTLAESNKVSLLCLLFSFPLVSHSACLIHRCCLITLMVELDVTNVRQLEDFLINACMYAGIVTGKLDQLKRCFEVPFAAGRYLRPGQLGDMLHAFSNW